MKFIAHRGESVDAPENTLAAFRLAWERQDEAIELDVHLTKDGVLACCHNETTDETTGVAYRISEVTMPQLKELDAGRWKGEPWAGEKIPTLEEALAAIPSGAQCFIEIKGDPQIVPEGSIDALKKAVDGSKLQREQLVVISFAADAIAETKRKLPWMTSYLLASYWGDFAKLSGPESARRLIEAARACRADGLNLGCDGPIDRDYIQRMRDAGLGIYVWTIDDVETAARMVELGVDGITSNRAAWLKAQLGIYSPRP